MNHWLLSPTQLINNCCMTLKMNTAVDPRAFFFFFGDSSTYVRSPRDEPLRISQIAYSISHDLISISMYIFDCVLVTLIGPQQCLEHIPRGREAAGGLEPKISPEKEARRVMGH